MTMFDTIVETPLTDRELSKLFLRRITEIDDARAGLTDPLEIARWQIRREEAIHAWDLVRRHITGKGVGE